MTAAVFAFPATLAIGFVIRELGVVGGSKEGQKWDWGHYFRTPKNTGILITNVLCTVWLGIAHADVAALMTAIFGGPYLLLAGPVLGFTAALIFRALFKLFSSKTGIEQDQA